MNDSPYGLTASVWTDVDANPESEQAFLRIVDEVETGTVFLNRYGFYIYRKQMKFLNFPQV